MKSKILTSVLLAAASTATVNAAIYNTVGIYDPGSGSVGEGANNQVDFNASGNPLSSALLTDYAGFKAAVATAFSNNMGGVVDFDTQNENASALQTFNFPGGKSLAVTASLRSTEFGSDTATSGSRSAIFVVPPAGSDAPSGTMTFGALTGGSPLEGVVAFGITILGRTQTGTISLVATYSDGSTSPALSRSIPNGNTQDTFYGFAAPAGLSISSVALTGSFSGTGGQFQKTFDDVGIIFGVIPEPSALGLLAPAGLLLARRRR